MIHSEPETHGETLDALALSERFLLWNLRAWACSCRSQRLPAEPVRLAFQNVGIPDAATAIDAAMTHLVLATRRPLAVNCPPHTGLSSDETMLIAAAAAAQRQDCRLARTLLGQVLPGPALALVIGALIDLGRSLSTVGILLPSGEPRVEAASSRYGAIAARPTLH